MRLLVVTQYFWPENFRINDLVAEYVQRGHQVTVLTGLPNYPDGKVFEKYRKDPVYYLEYEGARVIRVPMLSRGQGGLRLLLNYIIFAISASVVGPWKLRGQKFDVIFSYEPSPITVGLPAISLRAIKRTPMAFWVLDLWPETLQAIGVVRSRFLLRGIGYLVSFIYKRCDLILAQSNSFIPQIKKYAGSRADVRFFPNWAESIFNMEQVTCAQEVPDKAGSFTVMFAGNIGDAQDFPAILAAAEHLKPHFHIRWLVLGDGRKREWVEGEIKRRGLQDCVLMLGHYPVDRMPSFFKHADTLLVSLKDNPIFAMTIPGKLQSYLAAGIPVMAMLNGEGADVVRDARAGLTCAAGDHEELARAVLELSQMPAGERQKMGENGLALSKKQFGRDILITKLEKWLKNLTM